MPYPIPENSGLYIEKLSPLSFRRHVSIARNITFCTLINSRRSNRSMKDVSQSKDIRFINISFAGNIYNLKSATTRLYDTEAKIICIVSKKGAQCIECHHKDI